MLNYTQLDLLFLYHHRQISSHQSSFLFLLCIRLDLVHAIGLAPDFESLGPCRISGLMLWVVLMLLRPAP